MASTHDYDNVGKTQFLTQLWGSDEESPFTYCLLSEYFNSKTAAQKKMVEVYRTEKHKTPPDVALWGEIRKGVWKDTGFEDQEYGWINDATFEDEGQPRAYAQPNKSGSGLEFQWEDSL